MTQKIIYFRESALQSIIADTYSALMLAGIFAFNHFVLGDSKVAATAFFVFFLIWLTTNASAKKHTFTSREELKKYIEENE